MDDYLKELLSAIQERTLDKAEVSRLKIILARKHPGVVPPADYDLYLSAPDADQSGLKPLLRSKPMRTQSGVAVIAVMSKPGRCPHGTCTMCPGGVGSVFGDVPQSYTGHEPATLRGLRNGYDAYLQVFNRLEQYHCLGHSPQKAEVIVMGGTFLAYSAPYKEAFIGDIYRAMNDFSRLFYEGAGADRPSVEPLRKKSPADKGVAPFGEMSAIGNANAGEKPVGPAPEDKRLNGHQRFNMAAFKEFFELPGEIGAAERVASVHAKVRALKAANADSLEAAQLNNETAAIRCIGLTIETKPDWGFAEHGREMLRYGATRVELGLQSVYDDALARLNRGHSAGDNIRSVQELKDLGFKINAHIMPGLPGVDSARDAAGLRAFFEDPGYRPDMVKVYPCMVMPGTALEADFKAGAYIPLSTQEAAERIAHFKRHIPPYCRVMRIQRDIPTKYATAGLDKNNLRQLVDDICKRKRIVCQCIRCREIGRRSHGEVRYEVLEFAASEGKELFFQALATLLVTEGLGPVGNLPRVARPPAEANPHRATVATAADPAHIHRVAEEGAGENFSNGQGDRLVGFLRLRYPSQSLVPEITPTTAMVRELHVYGAAEPLGAPGQVQHRGIGKTLLNMAEERARQDGKDRMVVISGVGVREYYRQLGYAREGAYMVKILPSPERAVSSISRNLNGPA